MADFQNTLRVHTSDSSAALGQQITAIFMNLISAPDTRMMRIEECLNSLFDTLFVHSEEVGSNEALQTMLYNLIENVFTASTDKGIRAFRVVFDIRWKDQHEKRSHLLNLLFDQAQTCGDRKRCLSILDTVAEILEENIRSTTELLGDTLVSLLQTIRTAEDDVVRAASCEILATIVASCAPVIKHNPGLLEIITSGCPPLQLLEQTVENASAWDRKARIRLLTNMVHENCYEVTAALAKQMAEKLQTYTETVTDEEQIGGVLWIIGDVATIDIFSHAPWNLKGITEFLVDNKWTEFSLQTRMVAVYTAGKMCLSLLDHDDELYTTVGNLVLEFIKHDEQSVVQRALEAIEALLSGEKGLKRVSMVVNTLRGCIDRMPYMPLMFQVLERIRTRYGEDAVEPIYRLVDDYMAMKQEFVNFGRLNALLRFAGDRADLKRGEFMRLRVDLSNGRPEAILIRSLPLLTTLDRTNQLNDAVELMFHDDIVVRRTAIKTVISLSERIIRKADKSAMDGFNSSAAAKRLDTQVTYAVERILDVAVADRDPEIRLTALQELSPPFYPYLCLPDNLDALFMTRNDNDRPTRDESLILLCKLHPFHPAIVHPQLLRAQEFMLRDVDAQDSSIAQAIYKASLLRVCANNNSLLLQPNMVEKVVLQRLIQQPFVSKLFSIELLGLVKAVLTHSNHQYHCDVSLFMQATLNIINHGDSSSRRKAALETLTSILTAMNVNDYELNVDMFRSVARILRRESEETTAVITEAMRVMSTIGAINPVKIRKILTVLESDEIEDKEVVVTPGLAHYKPRLRVHPNIGEKYPSVVLYFLVKNMQLSIDVRLQVDTLATLKTLMQEIPGNQKAMLLTHLLPQLQLWLRDPEKAPLFENCLCLMSDLAALLRQFRDTIPSATGYELLSSVQQFSVLPQAAQNPLSARVVQLLDDLAKGLPAQDMRDHRWAVEFIHQRLSQNKNDLDLIHRVVKSLESFLVVLHEKDLQLILPHVLQCIEPAKTTPAARRPKMKDINDACFDFLNNIMVKQLPLLKECCAQIVHTIMWYIDLSDNQEEMDIGLTTLASLIDVVKQPAERFIMPVERVAEQNGYPKGYFVNLVQSAANGVKVRVPLGAAEHLNADMPLSLVSHLPRLTQKEFETEMRNTLRISDKDFEIESVTHPGGQTVINFRFCPGADQTACFNLFVRKAQDTKSSLRRNLGILKVEQTVELPRTIDLSNLEAIYSIPTAESQRREQSWIWWIHNCSFLLLKSSPYAALRCVCAIAERSSEAVRDLFPFAAAAIINQLDVAERKKLIDVFNHAVDMAPYDVKLILFSLAEFLEADRGKQKPTLVQTAKRKVFTVSRTSSDVKFGINYDQDPQRGVVVTKLLPNGLGAQAGVPLGGQLLAINDAPVRTVGDIRGMIDGLNAIHLTIAYTVEEHYYPEPKCLMDLPTLAEVGYQSGMHAKAIYFNEVLLEDQISKVSSTKGDQMSEIQSCLRVSERLIELYGHLNLNMVAHGLVLMTAKRFPEGAITNSEHFGFHQLGTLEQLRWWTEALRRYKLILNSNEKVKTNVSALVGALRCEDALGQVDIMSSTIGDYWGDLPAAEKKQVAPFRAKAAFSLGCWAEFDSMAANPHFLSLFPVVEQCAALFRQRKFDELLKYTKQCREALLEPFTEGFNESYDRCYPHLVQLEHLRHFEEAVSYVGLSTERQFMLRKLWTKRLVNMSPRPGTIKTVISINSLVMKPREDMDCQVHAVRCFVKAQWLPMASHLINQLLGPNVTKANLCKQPPDLIHAYGKYYFATKGRWEAYKLLYDVLEDIEVVPNSEYDHQWGQCWLLLGEWTMNLFPDRGDEAIEQLLRATQLSPSDSAAFHSLGILHYDLSRDPSTPQLEQVDHHISSVIALFKSVQLSSENTDNVMQDVLRILSVWFAHSAVEDLNEAVNKGVQLLSSHVWLSVIPQLIARIGITAKLARAILADLLVRVGTTYPQTLIYPLTVAEKSPDAIRRLMAERVLSGIRTTNRKMVEEASLISNELVRIAILSTEKWYAAIQQAAYKPDSTTAIMKGIGPLYEELEKASTPNERTFEKTFGQTLRRARTCIQERALDKAWSFLKQVYVQLNKVVGERRLYMSDVSPTLDGIRESIVPVPGTFEYDRAPITIQKFHPRVYVMSSKQKPRRLGLDASNGEKYRFLLKGHEDMRQDERVMQFIGLIDTLFSADNATSSIGLTLPRYSVIPLTDNVGLIGWVENTETIYKMLETYRHEHGVSIYEEVQLIIQKGGLQKIEDYHKQSKQQRKALLQYCIERTPNDELRRIVWEQNDTCEQWLSYRSTYGYTLAAMSMVGYVLGLGDRHLNNLMLKENGTVVHIDFGDCFEVAMHRALYAEAVPFRLTRLLVAALGITGVDGVYRLTCESVMKILRRNSENLLSILEAFIYDPLINWRLATGNDHEVSVSASRQDSGTAAASAAARPSVIDMEEEKEVVMQLSKSFSKPHTNNPTAAQLDGSGHMTENEEEYRNQQGDLALARVRAKLTGQEFGNLSNTSFSLMRTSKPRDSTNFNALYPFHGSLVDSQNANLFGETLRDSMSTGGGGGYACSPVGEEDALDVSQQVDRLIQEATSLQNLSDAYITGWAPFW